MLEAIDNVVGTSTCSELGVLVHTNYILGTINHRMANDKHFAKVELFALLHTHDFALQETNGREAPASTRTVLVLNGCDTYTVDSGKDKARVLLC